MASYRSDLAAEIKERLTARQVIEAYGFHPNRAGYIQCPFHAGDRHGSLKIYDGDKTGWHCFGCGAGSTVIDFVMKLFNINFRQACLRLDADFSLGLTGKRPSAAEISAVLAARRQEAERKVQGSSEKKSALLECMSNLTANEMFTKDGMKSEEEVVEKIVSEIQTLSQKLDNLVIVTNNVFEDGVIYDAGTMEYLRALGRINAALARLADRVAEVVVGIPVELKG